MEAKCVTCGNFLSETVISVPNRSDIIMCKICKTCYLFQPMLDDDNTQQLFDEYGRPMWYLQPLQSTDCTDFSHEKDIIEHCRTVNEFLNKLKE